MEAFVGRAQELEALVTLARSRSAPAAAIVVGEAGNGKSRLLAEARGRTSFAHVFAVIGYEPERHIPLAAAAEVLRALTQAPRHGAQIEALLVGDAPETQLEPLRVFETAHRALVELGDALLVVDDVHWVDELSLALCHYLMRAAQGCGQQLVVLAATRPGDRGASLADALPRERVSWIELGPLSRDEGIELAHGLDRELDADRAAELWARANGSPFWLQALVRSGGGIGLTQVLTLRLRGAGADAARLLALLAVAGRPLSVADAASLMDWPPPRLEAALRELVDHGLAIDLGSVVRLAHDLIREAAAAELPDETRRRLNRRLAEWIEVGTSSDPQSLRQALEQRRAGGLPTLDVALRLARAPRRKLLGAAGLELLAGIADEADPFAPEALALHEEVASLAADLAEHEEALRRWSLVAERVEEPAHAAAALLAASRAGYALARVDDARELLRRSRALDAADDVLALEQLTHDGEIRLWLEQLAKQGPTLAREAVAAASRLAARAGGVAALDDRARRAYLSALQLEYEAAVQADDPEWMLRSAEARAAAARGFDLEAHLAASVAACVALIWSGRVGEAARRLRSAWDEAHRQVFPRLAIDVGFWLARAHHLLGELAEAERIAREASELAERAGDLPRARHRVAKVACDIALELGQPRAALDRFRQETAAEPNEHQRIVWHGDLARWSARLEGVRAADAVREQVIVGRACAERVGCRRCGADLLLRAAEAFARIGDLDEARRTLAAWDRRPQEDELNRLTRAHVAALAEANAGARAAALRAMQRRADETPFRLVALWVQLDLGISLGGAGSERAPEELERAAGIARTLGAATVDELAGRALRSLGVRTWRRAAKGDPLTERELAVARCVANGSTNREIAQMLFLSPKTVERHVSNVFKKVGVRNRAELAARLRAPARRDEANAS